MKEPVSRGRKELHYLIFERGGKMADAAVIKQKSVICVVKISFFQAIKIAVFPLDLIDQRFILCVIIIE